MYWGSGSLNLEKRDPNRPKPSGMPKRRIVDVPEAAEMDDHLSSKFRLIARPA
jgi:hypothetical protein